MLIVVHWKGDFTHKCHILFRRDANMLDLGILNVKNSGGIRET